MCPSSTTSSDAEAISAQGFRPAALIEDAQRPLVGWHLLAAGLFGAVIIGTLVLDVSLPNDVQPVGEEKRELDRREREASFWNGTLAQLAAFKLRLRSNTRNMVLPPFSAALLSGFGHTSAQVVLGKDKYLFHAHTVGSRRRRPEEFLAETLHRIRTLAMYQRALNVKLLVVPVPSKAMVMHDHLPEGYFDHRDDYEFLLKGLRASGIRCVDLLQVLEQRKSSGEQVFLRADSHWTQIGAMHAARAVASAMKLEASLAGLRLRPAGPFPDFGNALDVLGMPLPELLKGGLARRILEWGGYAQSIQTFHVIDAQGQRVVKPDPSTDLSLPYALVGSSFSLAAGFHELLMVACGTRIRTEAVLGGGGWQGWSKLLQRGAGTLPRQVIWEMPLESLIVSQHALGGLGEVLSMMPLHPRSMRLVGGSSIAFTEVKAHDGRRFKLLVSLNGEMVNSFSGAARVLRLTRATAGEDLKVEVEGLQYPWQMSWPKGVNFLSVPLSEEEAAEISVRVKGRELSGLQIIAVELLDVLP